MSRFGSLYVAGDSIFHKMNPVVKALMFILWSTVVFMPIDIRTSVFLVLLGSLLLYLSRIPCRTIKNLFFAVVAFNFVNVLFILVIYPESGIALAGQKTVLVKLSGYQIYAESVIYLAVLSLKYLSLLPVAMIFIFTTHPSQFACSLNKIGVPYRLAYTFNLIFRYLPEVILEFRTVSKAQAARGVTFGKDEPSFWQRVKILFNTIVPLMNSALERIDEVTVAMELRSFGKKRVRTWYNGATFTGIDAVSLLIMIPVFALLIWTATRI